tara:strand:- start:138152 stop:138301 length:150 start_codon:yes stop_codon:yes gene_type:complete
MMYVVVDGEALTVSDEFDEFDASLASVDSGEFGSDVVSMFSLLFAVPVG